MRLIQERKCYEKIIHSKVTHITGSKAIIYERHEQAQVFYVISASSFLGLLPLVPVGATSDQQGQYPLPCEENRLTFPEHSATKLTATSALEDTPVVASGQYFKRSRGCGGLRCFAESLEAKARARYRLES